MGWTRTDRNGLCRKTRPNPETGEVTIYPTFYVRVHVGGRDVRRSTRTRDPEQARVAAARIVADLTADAAGADQRGPLTMARLRELHEAEVVRNGATEKHRKGVAYLWDRLLERLADVDPLRLTYGQVLDYATARAGEVRGQTIRKELAALKAALVEARRRGYPVPQFDWPTVKSSPKDTARAGELHDLDVLRRWLPSIRAVVATTNRCDARAAIQAEFILLTGLRVTEARRVRLSWVRTAPDGDPVPAYLELPSAATKTRNARVVPLTDRAVDLLLEADDLVNDGDDAPLFAGDYKRAWKSAANRIGYPATITPRDLRHCYATYSSTANDIVATQTTMGHASIAMTSRYVHGQRARSAAAPLRVAELLAQAGDDRDPTPGPSTRRPVGPDGDSAGGKATTAVEANGFEPMTSCVQSRAFTAILEVVGDPDVAERVLAALDGHGLIADGWDPRPGPRVAQSGG